MCKVWSARLSACDLVQVTIGQKDQKWKYVQNLHVTLFYLYNTTVFNLPFCVFWVWAYEQELESFGSLKRREKKASKHVQSTGLTAQNWRKDPPPKKKKQKGMSKITCNVFVVVVVYTSISVHRMSFVLYCLWCHFRTNVQYDWVECVCVWINFAPYLIPHAVCHLVIKPYRIEPHDINIYYSLLVYNGFDNMDIFPRSKESL